ncbi:MULTISPECIES: DUF3613 domain-containing protein [Ralstonia solanacearum species complex]|uniref:DUF3613 domain-containing protein n=1 Tax=Ralstonia solanacearum species complex TaxID=3116862 RepID=UPI000E590114|nr:DUF3613 domain-containing protein [Ralstonia solanacearum]BEU74642.1 hypothetical protein MAFF211271_41970 [Ralstonia pseudosolanacearum]AXV79480.1 hypothetical protein CJO76_21395 [Ralstonia solanacearum]AXV93504.1 hypothetical protein CJO79_21370 [Ralstonia solanacearum]AXW21520.1 hypothetical protein CJO85_21470 [Ralstonia solanacearum]AXW78394.1 hypothetical protein CJO97_21370 [Ralstonia solanacearum]
MTSKIVYVLCAAALGWSGQAGAQGFSGAADAAQAAPQAGLRVNDATHALLSAQRDGTYAGEAVPLRGEQAALAYQRYLDTFSRPMPGLSQGNSGQRSATPTATTGTSR